jgi:hypothetical protein
MVISGLFGFRNKEEIIFASAAIGCRTGERNSLDIYYHEQAPLLQWIGVIEFSHVMGR